jgi:hypothetical protein
MSEYIAVAINSRIETDEVLGPLPEDWECAVWGPRKLFVDHSKKLTSWIDPRTRSLRKHDITEIVEGELPYGWEEAFDEVCGVYYMDHVNRLNFLEGPWNESVQKVIIEKLIIQEEEARDLQHQLEADQRKKEEVALAEEKMRKLEAARLKLERDLQKLHSGTNGDDLELDDEEERLRAELFAIEQDINQEQVEYEEAAAEQEDMNQEILDFQNRLREIQMANDKMEGENDQLIVENNKANKELDDIRNMIEAEATQRANLENYIKSLKLEVIEMYDPNKAEQMRELTLDDEEEAPLPIHGSMSAEVELLELKARLEAEKEERHRLKELTETLEAERNRIQEEMLNEDEVS